MQFDFLFLPTVNKVRITYVVWVYWNGTNIGINGPNEWTALWESVPIPYLEQSYVLLRMLTR